MNLSLNIQSEKEKNRVEALMSYDVMDTPAEIELDEITKIAFITCETPISLISLLDESRQWFKSNHGLECNQTPKEISFCQYTIQQQDLFIVQDSLLDDRFKSNPLVLGYPFIRFYAGMPLVAPSGYSIGSLCVIDRKPRILTDNQQFILKSLAKQVITNFELRKNYKDLKIMNENSQKLSKAKEEFFSNMSHELRTPLNAISGFTENLSRTNLDPKQKEQLEIIHTSVNILISIVNDILDYSKIDNGSLKIEKHPFNLTKVIQETYELLRIKANERKLRFLIDVNETLPDYIYGDKVRLNQILINLLGNAIKFTNKGSVTLCVRIIENIKDEIVVHFSVKDTGIGIPSDKLNGIFDRFQQVEGTVRVYGGSGLGLNISKSLVELQNGKLEVKSEFGKGSEFSFSIKYAKLSPEESKLFEIKNTNQISTKPNLDNVKVLVAEDNKINVKLIQNFFEGTGAYLDVTENGRVCLEKLKQNSYDIILMDSNMPEMDGHETTMHIRNTLRLTTPIIGLSANISVVDREKSISVGMNYCLAKPFKMDELFKAVTKLCKRGNRNLSRNLSHKDSLVKNKTDTSSDHCKTVSSKNILSKYLTTVNSKENIFKLKFKPKTPLVLSSKFTLPSKIINTNSLQNSRLLFSNNKSNHLKIKYPLASKTRHENIIMKSLNEYSGNDKEFEKQLMDVFIDEIPLHLKDLEEEVIKEDYLAIKSASHKIKSPLGIFGLVDLKYKLDKIEELASKSDIIRIIELLSVCKINLNRILSEIKVLQKKYD